MKNSQPILVIVVLLLVIGFSIQAQRQAATAIISPETLVANLYKQHKKASPFFQTRSRALVDRYFDKPLANLIWKDSHTSKDEVGALDGDPLYNAQDMEIKHFAIGNAQVERGTARLTVSFTNFNKKEEIVFDLVLTSPGWRISNLTYGDGTTLKGILKQN